MVKEKAEDLRWVCIPCYNAATVYVPGLTSRDPMHCCLCGKKHKCVLVNKETATKINLSNFKSEKGGRG